MKFHYVYAIHHLDSEMHYVGKRSGSLTKGYYGSGKYIRNAIRRHGKSRFIKVILSIHDTPEEALEAERNLVTPEFVERKDTYNLKPGGTGGFPTPTEVTRKKISANKKGNKNLLGYKHTDAAKAKMRAAKKRRRINGK